MTNNSATSTPPRETRAPSTSDVSDSFKAAFRGHPAGVAVITADPGSGPVGLTATSVVSISAEPPTLLFSLSGLSSAAPGIAASDTVVVHFTSDLDVKTAQRCAAPAADRFSDASLWSTLPTGEPVFHGIATWLRCRIIERVNAGGSTVIIAEAMEASGTEPRPDAAPLVYHSRRWHRLDNQSVLA